MATVGVGEVGELGVVLIVGSRETVAWTTEVGVRSGERACRKSRCGSMLVGRVVCGRVLVRQSVEVVRWNLSRR